MGMRCCDLVSQPLWPWWGDGGGQGLSSPVFSGLHSQSATVGHPVHGGWRLLPTTACVYGTGGHFLRAETRPCFWKTQRLVGRRRTPLCVPLTVTPRILRAMLERQSEFTSFKQIRIAMGTWNVNGGKQFRSNLLGTAELADWLLDSPRLSGATEPQGECGGFYKKKTSSLEPLVDLAGWLTCEIWCLAFSFLRGIKSPVLNLSRTHLAN